MSKKTLLSLLSGFVILLLTWVYQNYSFTFSAEDAFIAKISFWKYKIFSAIPKRKADFVFINTAKDLALVNDTADYGSVSVSDRVKMYNFLHFVDSLPKRPVYTVVDIQFYYPYTINPRIDTLMQEELKKNDRLLIAVLPDHRSTELKYKMPLYEAKFAYSEYLTFSAGFNKFRILNQQSAIPSVGVAMDEAINKAVYRDYGYFATCNGHLCMSGIWPSLYMNDAALRQNKPGAYAQFYNLGEIMEDIQTNPEAYADFFTNKIVIIGNFDLDTHYTPIGQMAGSVIVGNIYLSLVNGHHLISYVFLFLEFLVLSGLSYLAWFSKVPEVSIRFNFIFSPHLVKLIKSYISYFGSMFLLSLVALLFFNMQVALFFPSMLFSGIEYFRQKKYLPEK